GLSGAGRVEVKDLSVGLDWIALRFPAGQSTLEELDSGNIPSQSSMQDCSAGFVARTSTVNDHVFFFGNQRRPRKHLFWRYPLRAGDDFRIGQQVERLSDVKKKHLLIRREQRVEFLWCDAVLVHLALVSLAFHPNHDSDREGRNNN